jgi:hypothetical protein
VAPSRAKDEGVPMSGRETFVPASRESRQSTKILTKEDVRELLKEKTLDTLTAELFSHLQLLEGAYSTPLSLGVQIALSRLFAYLVLRDSPVSLYVTGWGVATEHLDLFYSLQTFLRRPASLDGSSRARVRADRRMRHLLACFPWHFSTSALSPTPSFGPPAHRLRAAPIASLHFKNFDFKSAWARVPAR